MTPELKPCPFCGEEAELHEDPEPIGKFVICRNGCSFFPEPNAWNCRHKPDLTEALARLKALEERLTSRCNKVPEIHKVGCGCDVADEIAAIRKALGASDAEPKPAPKP